MNSLQDKVLQQLQGIFDELFLDDIVVTPELAATDVEEWDSLTHISLVIMVEERFGIKFRVGEVEATKNVGEFMNIISERMGRQNV